MSQGCSTDAQTMFNDLVFAPSVNATPGMPLQVCTARSPSLHPA
jgi:hypothetical protein